jgi:hypothetical protein
MGFKIENADHALFELYGAEIGSKGSAAVRRPTQTKIDFISNPRRQDGHGFT